MVIISSIDHDILRIVKKPKTLLPSNLKIPLLFDESGWLHQQIFNFGFELQKGVFQTPLPPLNTLDYLWNVKYLASWIDLKKASDWSFYLWTSTNIWWIWTDALRRWRWWRRRWMNQRFDAFNSQKTTTLVCLRSRDEKISPFLLNEGWHDVVWYLGVGRSNERGWNERVFWRVVVKHRELIVVNKTVRAWRVFNNDDLIDPHSYRTVMRFIFLIRDFRGFNVYNE